MADVITTVGQRLWSAMTDEDLSDLATIVKVGNRTSLVADGTRTLKDRAQAADLPEVVLTQGAFRFNQFSSAEPLLDASQAFSLVVSTDQLGFVPVNRVKVAVAKALWTLGPQLGGEWRRPDTYDTPYPPLCFVRGWDVAGQDLLSTDEILQLDAASGTLRAKSVLTITVMMHLSADDL